MHARAKLLETVFFLKRMKEVGSYADDFCFYLSALTSAFRSVTFALQSDYASSPFFADLYEPLKAEMALDTFARGMRDARNAQLHEGHTWPRIITLLEHPESGRLVEFEGAPLPSGFDRLRGARFTTPPLECIPLGNDQDTWLENGMRQLVENLLALQRPGWTQLRKIKVCKSMDAITVEDFFQNIESWLSRFDAILLRFERLTPCREAHHVSSQSEDSFTRSMRLNLDSGGEA